MLLHRSFSVIRSLLWTNIVILYAVASPSQRQWEVFQNVFIDMPEEALVMDEHYIVRAISRAYCAHVQAPLSMETILGESMKTLIGGQIENEAKYLEALHKTFTTGEQSIIMTNNMRGSQYEMENTPLKDQAGHVYALKHTIKRIIILTSRDYLRLLQTESEKSTWKILVNSLKDYAIFVISSEFVIKSWSEQCERVYQWTEEEVIGKFYTMLYSEEPNSVQKLSLEENPFVKDGTSHTVSHKRKNGDTFVVEEKLFPIFAHGVHVGNSVINKDLTALSQSQSQLLEAREQSQKSQNNFLSSISHESRSNTAIIISSIEALLDPTSGSLNGFQQETCEDMHQASRLLLQVVDDILDHASFTKVGIHLKTVEFDIHKLILGVMKLQSKTLKSANVGRISSLDDEGFVQKAKNIDLTCYIDPALPAILYGDDIRVSQILTNLVSNGIKFTDEGEVEVRVEMAASHYPDRIKVVISVRDTGVGISDAQQPLLFAPFYQADAGLSRKQTGTGLGLSNVKMLAEAMNGMVTVISSTEDPNHGSTFSCQIHIQNRPAENQDLKNTDREIRPGLQKRFLSRQRSYSVPEMFLGAPLMLVEDNTILAKFAQRALTSLGFSNVVWVDDGKKAIKEAKRSKDLILMDLHLPFLDGLEATRQIRLFDERVAIVALTANALEQDKEMCLEAGMNDHLSKPISIKELKETIVLHLGKLSDWKVAAK